MLSYNLTTLQVFSVRDDAKRRETATYPVEIQRFIEV
jgi:hypothetical protein